MKQMTQIRCRRTGILLVLATGALMIGCQSGYRSQAKVMTGQWDRGDYSAAQNTGVTGARSKADSEIDRVVYNLEAGRTSQAAGNYDTSIEYYDLAYQDVRPFLDTDAEDTVSEAVATTAVNQTLATYKGTPNERIMLCTMQSLNYMAKGDQDSARIELNRAHDWQEDAEQRYAKEIEREQAKIRKEARNDGNDYATGDEGELPSSVASHFTYLEDMRGYGAYRNPFASHLRGVFLLTTSTDVGDMANARTDFSEVAGMSPDARAMLEEDLVLSDRPPNRACPPTTWVYFLTGRAPHKEELRIDIPIPVGKVNYVSAAFPKLVRNRNHNESLEVHVIDGPVVETVTIADIDRIVGSEFRERLPTIVTQEIISSAGKAAATYALAEGAGGWGQAAGIIYQAASTSADTRSWRTMPREVQVARVPTPDGGELTLVTDDGRQVGHILVAPGESNIVVVTLPSTEAIDASFMIIQLTGEKAQWTDEPSDVSALQPVS